MRSIDRRRYHDPAASSRRTLSTVQLSERRISPAAVPPVAATTTRCSTTLSSSGKSKILAASVCVIHSLQEPCIFRQRPYILMLSSALLRNKAVKSSMIHTEVDEVGDHTQLEAKWFLFLDTGFVRLFSHLRLWRRRRLLLLTGGGGRWFAYGRVVVHFDRFR